jgi:hypothetical protein
MRKEQLVRGRVKPQPHQTITIHQTTKAERDRTVRGSSFWMDAPRDGFTQQASEIFGARYRVAVIKKQTAELRRPTERICAWPTCHKKFALKLRGPHRIYCSHACTTKASKKRIKAGRRVRVAA